jgi:hypothetical protein
MRSFYRGGNYNSSNAYGFASFNGNNDRSNTNTNIGFRSALPSSQKLSAHGLAISTTVIKGFVSSVCDGHRQKNYRL